MKVTISQEFDSIEAAQAFLSQFAPAVVVDPQPVPASSSNVAAKRGRPRKAAAPQATETSAAPAVAAAPLPVTADSPQATAAERAPEATAATPDPAVAAPGAPVTREAAMTALRGLFNAKGEKAATAVLAHFKVASFSGIPADRYGEMMVEINKQLAA